MKPVLLLVACCVMASAVDARHVVHNARDGETLEALSARYYGTGALSASLAAHNSLGDGLTTGSVIEIPLSDEHVVEEGDDWGTLAARYWGDWELAEAMPALVRPENAPLQPGTRLEIPALIHHRVQPGESLAVLSRRCYRDPERALAIARLNGISDPNQLLAGQHLRLPVFGSIEIVQQVELAPVAAAPEPAAAPVTPRAPRAPQPPQAPEPPRPVASSDLNQALADAIEAYHQGEFSESRSALETLRPPVLESGTVNQRRALLETLLLVHTAFDDADLCCQSLAELRQYEDPQQANDGLDPERFSPKVRELAAACP